MIIIRLQGGLGNQMFLYALYLQLLQQGQAVKIDDAGGYEEDRQRRPALEECFGASYERASLREVRMLRDALPDPFHRARRKLFGRRNREWEEPDGRFYPEVLAMDDAYLNGYFQSERYFPDDAVRAKLCAVFAPEPRGLFSGAAGELARRIKADGARAVSLHLRRGDYLLPGTAETHGGICTEDYYARAAALVQGEIDGAVFYVFSDDADYARDFARRAEAETPGSRYTVAACGGMVGMRRDAAELMLMSRCRHHILANSSYSWWGAWLSGRGADGALPGAAGKRLVIAPDRWYNKKAADAVYTEEMRRI